jgi:hypothetical protein
MTKLKLAIAGALGDWLAFYAQGGLTGVLLGTILGAVLHRTGSGGPRAV